MKKILMFALFAVAALFLCADKSFAQINLFGTSVTAPDTEINISSQVTVTNNIFQPGSRIVYSTNSYTIAGGVVYYSTTAAIDFGNVTANYNSAAFYGSTMTAGDILGSWVNIITGGSIGNIFASSNSAVINWSDINGGNIYGSAISLEANGSIGNITSNGNEVSVKNSPTLYLDGARASYIYIGNSIEIGNITANLNTVEIDNILQISEVLGSRMKISMPSSFSFNVYSNKNKISINSAEVEVNNGVVSGSHIEVDGVSNIISNENEVTISYSTTSYVAGSYVIANSLGYSQRNSVQVNGNVVSISSSNLYSGRVMGSLSAGDNVTANSNKVIIEDSIGVNRVYGSYVFSSTSSVGAQLSGQANGSSVSVKNITSAGAANIYGAYLWGGNLLYESVGYGGFETNNNYVEIENLTNTGSMDVFGAFISAQADTGRAYGNTVYVLNSAVNGVNGGFCTVGATGTVTTEITVAQYANENNVILENSALGVVYGGRSFSGWIGSGNTLNFADGNRVTVTGGSISNSVYGGAANSLKSSGQADNNYVELDNVTVNNAFGGFSQSFSNAQANNNTVKIITGSVNNIYGGYAQSSLTSASIAKANYNSVILENISGYVDQILGGEAYGYSGSEKVSAINNKVTVIGNLNVGTLYGGWAKNYGTSSLADFFTGNTLEIKSGQLTVGNMSGFENYNFYIEDSNITTPIIYVTSGMTNLANTNVKLTFGTDADFSDGDRIVLIESVAGLYGSPKQTQVIASQGAAWADICNIYVSNKQLIADFVERFFNPQTKSLSEGVAAAAIAAGLAANTVSGELLSPDLKVGDMGLIGAVTGGSSKYNTGSSVSLNDLGIVAGIERKFESLSLGVFAEYVTGNFETENEFSGFDSVKGDGKVTAVGGGILGKKEVGEDGDGYIEGLIRAGQISNEYNTELANANYEYSSMYFGLGLGAGVVFEISEKVNLDLSGGYTLTSVGGSEVELPTKEKYKFDSVLSNRIKAGAKGEYEINNTFKPYLTVSYDYELSGAIKAQIDGHDIEAPTLNGGTFSGGIGMGINIFKNLTLDLSAQTFSGVREGFSGSLKIKLEL